MIFSGKGKGWRGLNDGLLLLVLAQVDGVEFSGEAFGSRSWWNGSGQHEPGRIN